MLEEKQCISFDKVFFFAAAFIDWYRELEKTVPQIRLHSQYRKRLGDLASGMGHTAYIEEEVLSLTKMLKGFRGFFGDVWRARSPWHIRCKVSLLWCNTKTLNDLESYRFQILARLCMAMYASSTLLRKLSKEDKQSNRHSICDKKDLGSGTFIWKWRAWGEVETESFKKRERWKGWTVQYTWWNHSHNWWYGPSRWGQCAKLLSDHLRVPFCQNVLKRALYTYFKSYAGGICARRKIFSRYRCVANICKLDTGYILKARNYHLETQYIK